ncbi:MAG TPA: SRPBCC domain-containing protein [Candidatus Tectomicrobia bacterium]|jgi:carbon monoxide dehydrogenase subunit G
MNFMQTCTINASREAVWDFLMNMDNVAHCLDGVQAFTPLDPDTYEGTLRVKVGPVALSFQGTVRVEARDREQWRGVVRAEAKDRRVGGGVRAHLQMHLEEKGPTATEMHVALEAHVLGKIGEFGQPLIRKKTETMLEDFATQVSQRLQ